MAEAIIPAGKGAAAGFLSYANDATLALPSITTTEEGIEAVDSLDRIKKMLEAVNEYQSVISEYCRLEAETVVRLAELFNGYASYLKIEKYNKKLAKVVSFLNKKDAAYRSMVVSQCVNRCSSIITIVLGHIAGEREDSRLAGYRDVLVGESDAIVHELKTTGKTTLSVGRLVNCCSPTKGLENTVRSLASGMTERTRDKILAAGGVGIGDNQYVIPTEETIRKALGERLVSVSRDLTKIAALCNQFGIDDGSTIIADMPVGYRELCLLAIEQFSTADKAAV